jgi:hypothetical protein
VKSRGLQLPVIKTSYRSDRLTSNAYSASNRFESHVEGGHLGSLTLPYLQANARNTTVKLSATASSHVPPSSQSEKLSLIYSTFQSRKYLFLYSYNKTNEIHLHTYLLTPWSRVLLEKLLTSSAASQEIPRIFGTRRFITVLTSARHLSLS